MTSRLAKLRDAAAVRQDWCCIYCGEKMLPAANCSRRKGHALACTAEHLIARRDGGRDTADNIVAACWFCNSRRHRRRVPTEPLVFSQYVRRRMRAGRWNRGSAPT